MSETIKLKGFVHSVSPITNPTEKVTKQDFVLQVPDGNYTQYIKIECINKMVEVSSTLNKLDEVEVSVNIGGRLWTKNEHGAVEQCFNSIKAWKIDVLTKAPLQSEVSHQAVPVAPAQPENDLPF